MSGETKIFEPNIQVPLVPAGPNVSVDPKITTMIGQMTTGTATAGVLLEDVDVNTENALFGADSMIATMVRNFRKYNLVSQINAIPLDDNGSGADATGTVTFGGTTASENGNILIHVGSEDRIYNVPVAISDTPTAVGDAFAALVTADTSALVDAVNVTGTVTLTAVNAGTVGNSIGIQFSGTVAGITTTIVAMASGATDPVMTGIAALIVNRTDIVMPHEYGIDTFVTLLDTRFNSDNIALDGRLITAITDTKANLVVVLDAENSQSLVIFGDKPVAKATKTGSAIFEMPYNKSSQFQGIRTLRLETNPQQTITDFVTTTSSKDQRSGTHTNSLPYHNTPFAQLPVIPLGEGFADDEILDIYTAGGSLQGNNRADNTIITGRVKTTYKTNAQGLNDSTYEFLNFVDTSTAAREFILNNLAADYGQKRLTLGQGVAGFDFATTGGVKADMISYFTILSGDGFVLLQGGVIESTGQTVGEIFKANLTVSFDIQAGDIFITSILPIVTQVRSIFAPLQITFNVTDV